MVAIPFPLWLFLSDHLARPRHRAPYPATRYQRLLPLPLLFLPTITDISAVDSEPWADRRSDDDSGAVVLLLAFPGGQ